MDRPSRKRGGLGFYRPSAARQTEFCANVFRPCSVFKFSEQLDAFKTLLRLHPDWVWRVPQRKMLLDMYERIRSGRTTNG